MAGNLHQLNPKKLPKVHDVIQFVLSRTSVHKGSERVLHKDAVHEMSSQVCQIWSSAECAPKSLRAVKLQFEGLLKEWQALKKKKKPSELRNLESQIFDVVTPERYRKPEETFDFNFYTEQLSTYKLQISQEVNPDYIAEKEEGKKEADKKKKLAEDKIRRECSSLKRASSSEVKDAIESAVVEREAA